MSLNIRQIFIYIICLATVPCTCSLYAQNRKPQVSLNNSEQFFLRSDYTEDSYLIQVCLPESYETSEKNYPVVYVPDGEIATAMTRDISRLLMFRDEIEEIIIVGISYGTDMEAWWNKRARDYTPGKDTITSYGRFWPQAGGANKYISFIERELITFIDQSYRTAENNRTLIGNSLAGLFASYVLFYRSSLFENYIILSPTLIWQNKKVLSLKDEYFNRNQQLRKKVYISTSSGDSELLIGSPSSDLISDLETRGNIGLIFRSEFFDGDTQNSALPKGICNGLRFCFGKQTP